MTSHAINAKNEQIQVTKHFINYERFDITVKTISELEYEVVAVAGILIEFTAKFGCTKPNKVDFAKRKQRPNGTAEWWVDGVLIRKK